MLNTFIVDGRLGKDPEEVGSDSKVVKFSIAQNRTFTNGKGQKVEETHWFPIVAFGKVGAACAKFLVKGSEVTIQGSLRENSWIDKETGKRMSRLEVHAQNVKFGAKPTDGSNQTDVNDSDDNADEADNGQPDQPEFTF